MSKAKRQRHIPLSAGDSAVRSSEADMEMENDSPWQVMAREARARARRIVEELDIEGHWCRAGGVVHAVGSFRTGLLVRHRDIDFHVYTPKLDVKDSFRVMAELACSPHLHSLHFINSSRTAERCLEWHAVWQGPDEAPWQIDIIHMAMGSPFEGHFERFADRLCQRLDAETRDTILRLKYETPEAEGIHGVEYYQAVLEGGVRTLAELRRWRTLHPLEGVNLWMP